MKGTTMNLKLASITFAAAALVLAPAAFAGSTAPSNLDASATVSDSCNLSVSSGLAFTGFSPISGSVADTTGTISVQCTNGAIADVNMALSGNESGGQRRMVSGTDFLDYDIRSVSQTGSLWPPTGTGVSATADGSAHDITVYGRIPSGQTTVPTGSYSDTVAVTVNF
jgi:spore coat protein U domain-containing protein, fimbrial subunit CupE1/2/3/6